MFLGRWPSERCAVIRMWSFENGILSQNCGRWIWSWNHYGINHANYLITSNQSQWNMMEYAGTSWDIHRCLCPGQMSGFWTGCTQITRTIVTLPRYWSTSRLLSKQLLEETDGKRTGSKVLLEVEVQQTDWRLPCLLHLEMHMARETCPSVLWGDESLVWISSEHILLNKILKLPGQCFSRPFQQFLNAPKRSKRISQICLGTWVLHLEVEGPSLGHGMPWHLMPAMKTEPCPYKVLHLLPSASDNEIRSAYRKRALQTHPDKGGSAETWMWWCDLVVSPVDASGILDGFWGGFIVVYPCLSTV